MTTDHSDHERSPADQFADTTNQFHEQITLRRDLDLLRHTARWLHGCILCMRHRTEREHGFPKLGLIWSEHPLTVLQINLYDLPLCGGSLTIEEALTTRVDFPSHEALLREWEID